MEGVASPTQSQATKNSSSADTSLSGANVKKFLCADENGRYARMEKCLPKKATLIQYSPDALSDFLTVNFKYVFKINKYLKFISY